MTRHPEQFDRGSDGQPYDHDEPLLVRWADVVAARNAAEALLVVLKDAEVDLEATSRAVGWQVRDWLPTAGRQGRSRAARITRGCHQVAGEPGPASVEMPCRSPLPRGRPAPRRSTPRQ